MIVPSLLFRAPEDTLRFGDLLGALAQQGDSFALYGDLGAGKTSLTQGIAAGLGITDEAITSPTYALINEHLSGRIPLYHMDAYRIMQVSDLGAIGYDDYIAREDGLLVIEWADNITSELPAERLDIFLSHTHSVDSRDARFEAHGERALSLLHDALTKFDLNAGQNSGPPV